VLEQSKEKHLELARSEEIGRALRVGAEICSEKMRNDLRPLEVEMNLHKLHLKDAHKELEQKKNQLIRGQL